MQFYQRPDYDVLVAADVGKFSHHVFAVEPASGGVLFDGGVANRERDIDAALSAARAGRAMVVSDQPGPMSALLFACARRAGLAVRFLTPQAMHAVLLANDPDRKSDEWDARVIAATAHGNPHLLKEPRERDLWLAAECELHRLAGEEKTAVMNMIHERLLSESPAFEAAASALDLDSALGLFVLGRWGGPSALLRCGRANLRRAVLARRGWGEAAAARAEALYDAAASNRLLGEGAEQTEHVVRELAAQLAGACERKDACERRMAELMEGDPASAILLSMPGVGVVTAATFLAEVGDATGFRSSSALARYAGLSPRTARSGASLDSSSMSTSCNRRLRRVMILAANVARQRRGSASEAYYRRRREPDANGRREGHYHALVPLANKMIRTLYAMLRDGTMYQEGGAAA